MAANNNLMRIQKDMAGFTMIELLVVIAIIGLLTSLAAPPLTNMIQNNRLQSASQTLMGALRLARTEAVSRNRITHVELGGNNQVSVCAVDAVGASCPAIDDEDFIKQISLGPDTIEFSSNSDLAAGVSFTARGRLAQAGNLSIGVCDERGDGKGRFVQVSQVGRSMQRKIHSSAGDSCTP